MGVDLWEFVSVTNKADDLLLRMQRKIQPPMAPDVEPAECTPLEETIEAVMRRHGFTREVAIQELRKTGHF